MIDEEQFEISTRTLSYASWKLLTKVTLYELSNNNDCTERTSSQFTSPGQVTEPFVSPTNSTLMDFIQNA